MRIEHIVRELYQFEELDDKAKEKAREWYRRCTDDETFWSEQCTDDCEEQLKYLGFSIDHIYWTGFWSQGDGACFAGTWSAANVIVNAASDVEELGKTHAKLIAIARACPEASATVKQKGHYYHENCTEFSCDEFTDEDSFIDLAKDCMRWCYRQLEKAYEWQNANEQVDENIVANGYEFTKEGERA